MDAHFLGHETATPVRGVCGLLLEGLADDLRFVVRSDLAGSTRAWSVLEQLFNATCLVPVEPLRDRRPRYAHLPADRRPRPSLGRAENDVGPFDHALRLSAARLSADRRVHIRQRGAGARKHHFDVRASASLCSWLSCSYGTAAGAAMPIRTLRPWMGATPRFGMPRPASGRVGMCTPCHPPRGVAPVSISP